MATSKSGISHFPFSESRFPFSGFGFPFSEFGIWEYVSSVFGKWNCVSAFQMRVVSVSPYVPRVAIS